MLDIASFLTSSSVMVHDSYPRFSVITTIMLSLDRQDTDNRVPEDEARRFYRQLVLGIDYCHKKDIINRDIKVENMLLDKVDTTDTPVLKMCDFGYSINQAKSAPGSRVGTFSYMGMKL